MHMLKVKGSFLSSQPSIKVCYPTCFYPSKAANSFCSSPNINKHFYLKLRRTHCSEKNSRDPRIMIRD